MVLRNFNLRQSQTEHYTANTGLTLIGRCIKLSQLEALMPKRFQLHGITDTDLLKSYLGLISLGKSDFDAIENYRDDKFFQQALGIQRIPSSPSLRQRMDKDADKYRSVTDKAMIQFLAAAQAPVTPLWTGHAAMDMDVFPMDNSKTQKEGVSRTYKGHDGYAPMACYLGNEGWCLACELREGKQHGQKEFTHVLERVIPRARQLTHLPLLARLDSGHDALANRLYFHQEAVDYIIKWNPRKKDGAHWLAVAIGLGHWAHWANPRPGKRVATFTVYVEHGEHSFRRVMQVTERTIDKHGQAMLFPDVEAEGWWTSLEQADAAIIGLYRDHATSEQFHSEFKTDLDVERLPSGKFDTNDLVLACAAFAYNMLRLIGLVGLVGDHSPVRHPAKRRRVKTVLQELMYLAARVRERSRQLWLDFGKHCAAFEAFRRVYAHLAVP